LLPEVNVWTENATKQYIKYALSIEGCKRQQTYSKQMIGQKD